MGKPTYSEIQKYSRNLMQKHWVKTGESVNTLQVNDLVNEVFCQDFKCFEDAKKIIKDYLFKEARRLKAQRQYTGISVEYTKHCKYCNEVKSASEFGVRLDKRINLQYLHSKCRDCVNKHERTEEEKEKAKARRLRRKERQKNK